MTYGAFFVIIMFVEFMNGSLIEGDAYDYFVGQTLTKHERRKFFDCISGIESHDCVCDLDDSCHKYE